MNFSEVIHTKEEVLRSILSYYLQGFTVEEIMWCLVIESDIHLSMDRINDYLDYLIDLTL